GRRALRTLAARAAPAGAAALADAWHRDAHRRGGALDRDRAARGRTRSGLQAVPATQSARGADAMTMVAVRADGPALLDGYRAVMGEGPLRTLQGLARRLSGHRLVMVNSTATGGGVAEILHRLVRLLNELGVPTTWEVMSGDPRFYGITKTMHNR